MIKWIKRKLGIVQYSELALEIKEALEQDEWKADKYCLQHIKSGLQLWVCNGWDSFRIYEVPANVRKKHVGIVSTFEDEEYKKLLNADDRRMLFAIAQALHGKLYINYENSIINALRLSRQTEDL